MHSEEQDGPRRATHKTPLSARAHTGSTRGSHLGYVCVCVCVQGGGPTVMRLRACLWSARGRFASAHLCLFPPHSVRHHVLTGGTHAPCAVRFSHRRWRWPGVSGEGVSRPPRFSPPGAPPPLLAIASPIPPASCVAFLYPLRAMPPAQVSFAGARKPARGSSGSALPGPLAAAQAWGWAGPSPFGGVVRSGLGRGIGGRAGRWGVGCVGRRACACVAEGGVGRARIIRVRAFRCSSGGPERRLPRVIRVGFDRAGHSIALFFS